MRKAAKFIISVLVLGAIGLALAGSSAAIELTAEKADKLNLEEGTIVNNVSYLGTSLAGMTPEEALEIIAEPMEALAGAQIEIRSEATEDHTYGISAKNLGISWDKEGVESQLADAVVIQGKLLDRYKMAKDFQHDPVEIDNGLKINESSILKRFTDDLQGWNSEPVNADFTARIGSVTEFSQIGASREVIITPGKDGYRYDFTDCIHEFVENAKQGIVEPDKNGTIVLTPSETVIEPDITTERAESMSVIGYCGTVYPEVTTEITQNRETNLIVGVSRMDGHVFQPGEVVSLLAMFGAPTEENGYRVAGTFASTGTNYELGGGLCQVATTTYNAVLEAELGVVYRNHHSYTIGYRLPGLDAMVHPQTNQDFQFQNTSSDIIKIEGAIDSANHQIHVWIIGHEDHGPGHTVNYESVTSNWTLPTVTVIPDPSYPIGWSSPKTGQCDSQVGVTAVVYKVVYEDGQEVSRELFTGPDVYKPLNSSIHAAPDINVTPRVTDSLEDHYTGYTFTFLNGTSPTDNPGYWSAERRASFNAEMTSLLAQRGYRWPDQGSQFSSNGKVIIPDEMKKADDKKEDDKKDDDKKEETKADDKKEETTTTAAPEETKAPETEAPAPEPEDDGGDAED